jgi:hypothetical protein
MLQPSNQSGSVFLLHRDKHHTHAFSVLAPQDDGARPYFPCRHVKQQLEESSGWRRLNRANVQPPQSKIDHTRDLSFAGSLPGQNRPFRRGKTRVATKVVRGRHGNTRTNDTLFQFTIEGIALTPRIGGGTRWPTPGLPACRACPEASGFA